MNGTAADPDAQGRPSTDQRVAEGHGRYTFKDRLHYCYEARGSLQELVDDINECADNRYGEGEHLVHLRADAHRLIQLLDGWARFLRRANERAQGTKRASIGRARTQAPDMD